MGSQVTRPISVSQREMVYSMATVSIVHNGGRSRVSANYFTGLMFLQTNSRLMKMVMRMIHTVTITAILRRSNKSRVMRRTSTITLNMGHIMSWLESWIVRREKLARFINTQFLIST